MPDAGLPHVREMVHSLVRDYNNSFRERLAHWGQLVEDLFVNYYHPILLHVRFFYEIDLMAAIA